MYIDGNGEPREIFKGGNNPLASATLEDGCAGPSRGICWRVEPGDRRTTGRPQEQPSEGMKP